MKKVIFEGKDIFPTKILCVGRNYVEHIKELNNKIPDDIVFFIKPNSSISGQIIKPAKKCRYEGEISFLIFDNQIKAVGFGIDLTLVEEQEKAKKEGLPWEKAKAFDNSAIFSEFVEINNLENLQMELYINDNLRQKVDISLMIYKPYQIIQKACEYFSFKNGDILMTGTPKGVGYFEKGDKFVGRILKNNEIIVEKEWIVR
ncbi:fumarylacetoacetate hydrolase family protein [Hydrogenothermus marinus]|uniref:2-keto-4-pentenoate hydratase/2-oxohepta-3-ene-1,7-dioic acid hydratase in catechol pathway n=1 Tax=Hydrogenothermus marinus TaxID=133270 RepID=A0A3M0BQN2_9AQUI|nr:fumarylacetoacetate hydrolase family protein [Hydrogenothermus marinus]RMA97138.1 2-keto-4-pentenoate hydratase/2-oxohepta-3-ene-1,7-dioic acid hydratase in catechol pathway [Hydrogenothermus marinus]